jgi:hypothetical protein
MSRAIRNIFRLKKNGFEQLVIIILSAGDNPKMKIYGARSYFKLPNGQTILERQVDLLKKQFPETPIIVVHGYNYKTAISNAPCGIVNVVNTDYENYGIAKTILAGLQTIKHTSALLIYGDVVFNTAAIKIPDNNKSSLCLGNKNKLGEVGAIINDGQIIRLMYDMPKTWGQIAYITNQELNILNNIITDTETEKMTGFELINTIIDKGGKFIEHSNRFIMCEDIDAVTDVKKIEGRL